MAKNYVTDFRGENGFTPREKIRVKNEPISPSEENFCNHNYIDNYFEDPYGAIRKSLSMNDIATLNEDMANLQFADDYGGERHRRPTGAPPDLSRTKFVSMAEAIYHYQRDTPGRFHSTKPQIFRTNRASSRPNLTVPQSPMLRSKTRSRPVHIVSQKEKEELEAEEIKKFKIKANPVPKSVIEGTKNLPEVTKKPITVPEPFKLTELIKKVMKSPDQSQKFKARPAPKHIFDKPQIPVKTVMHVTKSVSPKIHCKGLNFVSRQKLDNVPHTRPLSATNKPVERNSVKPGPVKPEPFSFEKRNEELKRRKEERIKRQLEDEKKQATLFKAQPLPDAVKKQMQKVTIKGSSSTASSENKENHSKFEARPPVVLYKDPFKPVLQPMAVKQKPFELTTEKRAAEREKFDQLLKEKEEKQERLREQLEKERQEAEERAKAEIRSKLVHHAKPVPALPPFVPEKSYAPLTVPETPKFVRRLKKN